MEILDCSIEVTTEMTNDTNIIRENYKELTRNKTADVENIKLQY